MLLKFKRADIKKNPLTIEDGEKLSQYTNRHEQYVAFVLMKTGLYTPVLTIRHADKAWPRAYHKYPVIYQDPSGALIDKETIMIDIPDGYRHNGQGLTPVIPYEEIEKETADPLLQRIHGGGWGPLCTFYFIRDSGVAMPEDYTKDETVISPPDYAPSHAFIIPKKDTESSMNTAFKTVANDICVDEYGDFNIVTVRPSAKEVPSFLEQAKPLSLETYHWIVADSYDEALGITPPPMPQPVSNELSKHALMIPHASPTLRRLVIT